MYSYDELERHKKLYDIDGVFGWIDSLKCGESKKTVVLDVNKHSKERLLNRIETVQIKVGNTYKPVKINKGRYIYLGNILTSIGIFTCFSFQ